MADPNIEEEERGSERREGKELERERKEGQGLCVLLLSSKTFFDFSLSFISFLSLFLQSTQTANDWPIAIKNGSFNEEHSFTAASCSKKFFL